MVEEGNDSFSNQVGFSLSRTLYKRQHENMCTLHCRSGKPRLRNPPFLLMLSARVLLLLLLPGPRSS
jgi:hypothetical protein